MRIKLALCVLTASVAVSSAPAWATDDFREPVVAEGRWKSSERAAMGSAIWFWQNRVGKTVSERHADFWYSGERSFRCIWNTDGTQFQCIVSARPCARVY